MKKIHCFLVLSLSFSIGSFAQVPGLDLKDFGPRPSGRHITEYTESAFLMDLGTVIGKGNFVHPMPQNNENQMCFLFMIEGMSGTKAMEGLLTRRAMETTHVEYLSNIRINNLETPLAHYARRIEANRLAAYAIYFGQKYGLINKVNGDIDVSATITPPEKGGGGYHTYWLKPRLTDGVSDIICLSTSKLTEDSFLENFTTQEGLRKEKKRKEKKSQGLFSFAHRFLTPEKEIKKASFFDIPVEERHLHRGYKIEKDFFVTKIKDVCDNWSWRDSPQNVGRCTRACHKIVEKDIEEEIRS